MKQSRIDAYKTLEISQAFQDYLQEGRINREIKDRVYKWQKENNDLFYTFKRSLENFRDVYSKDQIISEVSSELRLKDFLIGFRIISSMKPSFILFIHETLKKLQEHKDLRISVYDIAANYYRIVHESDYYPPDYDELVRKVLAMIPSRYLPDEIREEKGTKKYYYRGSFYGISLLGMMYRLLLDLALFYFDREKWLQFLLLHDQFSKPLHIQFLYLVYYLSSLFVSEKIHSISSHYLSIESHIGRGKTTYSVLSLIAFMKLIGFNQAHNLSDEDLVRLFRINELETFYYLLQESSKRKIRIPLLILDDVSDWLGPYWASSSNPIRSFYEKIREIIIYGRSDIGIMMLIANSKDDIASFVRKLIKLRLSDYIIHEVGTTATAFYQIDPHEKKRKFDPLDIVDVFVFPIMRLPQQIYEEDLEHKRMKILEIAKDIAKLKRKAKS